MHLILLHPLPLDGSVWDPVRRNLAGTCSVEVFAPTLYGLGRSVEEWAEAVLDQVGPGPLVIAGNSVGGSCAIELARLAPDRVRSLVLIGAKAGHRPEPDLRDGAVRLLTEGGMAAAWPRFWAPLFAPRADPEVVETGRRIASAQEVDAVIGGVRAFHGRADRSEFVDLLDIAIHVVRGEHDAIPARAGELAAGLRQGTFHQVSGGGHYLPLERPAALASILSEVIGAVAPPAGPDPPRR